MASVSKMLINQVADKYCDDDAVICHGDDAGAGITASAATPTDEGGVGKRK